MSSRPQTRASTNPHERRDLLDAFLAETLGRGRPYWWRPRGASMAPVVNDGDRVLIAPVPAGRIRVGDVAKFESAGELRLHRLVRRRRGNDGGWRLTFRGDNSVDADPIVTEAAVIGVAVAVERHGITTRLDTRRARWMARLRMMRRAMSARTSKLVVVVVSVAGVLALHGDAV